MSVRTKVRKLEKRVDKQIAQPALETLDQIRPVDEVYFTRSGDVDPTTLFGGTWVIWLQGDAILNGQGVGESLYVWRRTA